MLSLHCVNIGCPFKAAIVDVVAEMRTVAFDRHGLGAGRKLPSTLQTVATKVSAQSTHNAVLNNGRYASAGAVLHRVKGIFFAVGLTGSCARKA